MVATRDWHNILISLIYRESKYFPLAHVCNWPIATVVIVYNSTAYDLSGFGGILRRCHDRHYNYSDSGRLFRGQKFALGKATSNHCVYCRRDFDGGDLLGRLILIVVRP